VSPPCPSAAQAAQRLQLWFSPAMPTGAFSHGHGIESAIADGDIHDAQSLQRWLAGVLARGAGRNDAILTAAAWRSVTGSPAGGREADTGERTSAPTLTDIDDLARALCAGAERSRETLSQGRAFADAVAAWQPPTRASPAPSALRQLSLPVVIGVVSAQHSLPLAATLVAALQAFVGNLAWIAARLLPLGQNATLRILAALESPVQRVARLAIESNLDDLGGSTMLADLGSLRHETLHTRVCLT